MLLDAVIHHGHMEALLAAGGEYLGLGPGDQRHGVFHLVGFQLFQHLGDIKMLRTGEPSVHAPLTAEYLSQRPGVYALDAGDVVFLQIAAQIALTAEVAPPGGQMADHKGLCPGPAGLVVLAVDPVIADEGIGHDHALSGVGGVGENLLVAGHGGVEHHLAHPRLGGADAGAGEDAPVG